MTKAAHTPGPWVFYNDTHGITIAYASKKEGGEAIASHVAKLYKTALCAEHGDLHANARLIAAAPDMAEALISAPVILEEDTLETFRARYIEWQKKKTAVLAKAGGEA